MAAGCGPTATAVVARRFTLPCRRLPQKQTNPWMQLDSASRTSTSRAKGKKSRPKFKLGIPDLEHSKAAVLRSLGSPDSRRGYQHAIDEFVAWYCSEPRLAFNKTVVLRYRFSLEERGLASGTINVRMAAVRRLAYEAADSGLLSPELAAGIHRVKGFATGLSFRQLAYSG